MEREEKESLEQAVWQPLEKGCRVLTTKVHGFTTDTMLLAAFSQPKDGEACADLGAGCGTISLLWKCRGKPGPILAVELQEEAAALMARSVEENGFSESIRVVRGDIRAYREIFPPQKLDLMACNPPYYPMGRGETGKGSRRTARHDETLTLEELAAAGKYGLRWGGGFYVCLRTERLPEAMEVFRRHRLEPKRLRLVQSGPEKPPYLFLLECRHGGNPGLSAEPTLVLTDGRGNDTEELRKIYRGNLKEEQNER